MKRNCPDCKKELTYKTNYKCNLAERNNVVCRSCCQKGKKHTEGTKQKISKALNGHVVSEVTRKKISKKAIERDSPSGWTLSNEIRKKMSIAKGGNGILNKNFSTYKLVKWAKLVKERDNYICQHCYLDGLPEEVDAHHIVPKAKFPQYAYDISNGQTLCRECHRIEHNKKPSKTF